MPKTVYKCKQLKVRRYFIFVTCNISDLFCSMNVIVWRKFCDVILLLVKVFRRMAKEELVGYGDPYLSGISNSVSRDICIILTTNLDPDNSESRFFRCSKGETSIHLLCFYPKLWYLSERGLMFDQRILDRCARILCDLEEYNIDGY